jgi:hypothetical protein
MDSNFLISLFISSLAIFGLYFSFDTNNVLSFFGDFVRKRLPERIQMPLTECVVCMASVWGTILFPFTGVSIFFYPIYIIALAGLNFIVNNRVI